MNEFVRRRVDLSWHIVARTSRVPGAYVTFCGRFIETPDKRTTLPGDEKTCERCAVLVVRAFDASEDDGSTQPVEMVP